MSPSVNNPLPKPPSGSVARFALGFFYLVALVLLATAICWTKQHTQLLQDCHSLNEPCIPDAHHAQVNP